MSKERNNLVKVIRQSPPIDTSDPYDPAWVAGKTIIITGGASGFGEGFARYWAHHGATMIVADIQEERGKELVQEMRKQSGNEHHQFVRCDVTSWESQVSLFKTAVKLSPTGGIDSVVANAGIVDNGQPFIKPQGLDDEAPPKPNWTCFDVNTTGVMFTAHLALFWLPRNPQSAKSSPDAVPRPNTPDRHLLLIGSVASLAPIPGLIQYSVSKHAVLGLFRSLRSTAFLQGVRVNMLCPYFIDTPLIPPSGKLLLAGGATGKPEDVVDAGTRLMADSRIAGRALVVGPKVQIDDEWQILSPDDKGGKECAVWECYADDFVEVDVFTARFIRMANSLENIRGWYGWATDVVKIVVYSLTSWVR